MRPAPFVLFLVAASIATAACTDEPAPADARADADAATAQDGHAGHRMELHEDAVRKKGAAVQTFVDHFDAQSCEEAEAIGSMRRTNADGTDQFIRSFQAPADCAADLEKILKSGGFNGSRDDGFEKRNEDGSSEKVLMRLADDGTQAGIEWEIEQK